MKLIQQYAQLVTTERYYITMQELYVFTMEISYDGELDLLLKNFHLLKKY